MVDILIGSLDTNYGRVYVIFGDIPPVLLNNSLYLYPGETVEITGENLAASDRNHNNETLVFIPTAISHGQFETISQLGTALVNFTQSQITNHTIRFVDDGTDEAPSYNITVRSSGIAGVGPDPAQIPFPIFKF